MRSFNFRLVICFAQYEVITDIMKFAPSGQPTEQKETQLRRKVVSDCGRELMKIWSKAFSAANVLSSKAVKKKIRLSLHLYYNKVILAKGNKRRAEMEFKNTHSELFNIRSLTADPEKFE